MDINELQKSERLRALKLFTTKHRTGFQDKVSFADWFSRQLVEQDFCCFYCETSIIAINHLITQGLLKTRATGFGVRGPVLEVDKKINEQGYIPVNCVLACYCCNNDKSYTLDAITYKQFFGANRKAFFDHLLRIIP